MARIRIGREAPLPSPVIPLAHLLRVRVPRFGRGERHRVELLPEPLHRLAEGTQAALRGDSRSGEHHHRPGPRQSPRDWFKPAAHARTITAAALQHGWPRLRTMELGWSVLSG